MENEETVFSIGAWCRMDALANYGQFEYQRSTTASYSKLVNSIIKKVKNSQNKEGDHHFGYF